MPAAQGAAGGGAEAEGGAEVDGKGVAEARALGAPERVTDCVCVSVVEVEGEGAVEREAASEALRCALAEGEQVGGAARPVVAQPPQRQVMGAPLPAGQ